MLSLCDSVIKCYTVLQYYDFRKWKGAKGMKTINVRDARKYMTNLDKLLEKEREVTITRRGEPIARLSAVGRKKVIPSHRGLRDSILGQAVQSENLIREDRDSRG